MRRHTLEVYQDKKGLFRWRFVAPNGKIVADGGEGYASRSNAIRAARRMTVVAAFAKLKAE